MIPGAPEAWSLPLTVRETLCPQHEDSRIVGGHLENGQACCLCSPRLSWLCHK